MLLNFHLVVSCAFQIGVFFSYPSTVACRLYPDCRFSKFLLKCWWFSFDNIMDVIYLPYIYFLCFCLRQFSIFQSGCYICRILSLLSFLLIVTVCLTFYVVSFLGVKSSINRYWSTILLSLLLHFKISIVWTTSFVMCRFSQCRF